MIFHVCIVRVYLTTVRRIGREAGAGGGQEASPDFRDESERCSPL